MTMPSVHALRALAPRLAVAATLVAAAALLSGCQNDSRGSRALRPISSETIALFQNKGVEAKSPVLLRAFKKEAELEVWKMKADGKYVHVKTYPMCRWSGQLGPKRREGDRQVPEGFYTITPGSMNPNSNYYLSFNIGYPNAYDRAHGRTGGLIMVHGACSSAGCFSMTDEQIAELYAIAREAFNGGQREIQMQSMPFRMNAENLAKFRFDPHMSFWRELKKGVDAFEVTQTEPTVGFCGRRYVFNATTDGRLDANAACPPLRQDEAISTAVAAKERQDEQQVAELVAKGVKPIKIVYADGGQHPDFRHIDMVSRPEALAQGPTEIELDHKGKPAKSPVVQVAAAKAAVGKPASVAAAPAAAVKAEAAKIDADVTGTAKPAATSTSVARAPAAAPAAPAVAATPVETEAFYKRWLSFGRSSEPKPAAVEALEPATPAPAAAPTPPRRAAAPSAKPQASLGPAPAAMTGLRAAMKEIPGAARTRPAGVAAYAAD